jgi:hypothetical protein
MRTPLLFTKTLVRAHQSRSFQVQAMHPVGWETSERDGQRIVQQHRHTDWHRVERTVTRFSREIDELRRQGWREA